MALSQPKREWHDQQRMCDLWRTRLAHKLSQDNYDARATVTLPRVTTTQALSLATPMGVTGIGGIFFRARDPKALSTWYKEHLQIGAGCNSDGTTSADEWYWQTASGPTVFAPFKESTEYFAADKQFMLNLRVSGLDALLESLRAAGIAVETRAEWDSPETGRFARIHDPEGTALELWEPPA